MLTLKKINAGYNIKHTIIPFIIGANMLYGCTKDSIFENEPGKTPSTIETLLEQSAVAMDSLQSQACFYFANDSLTYDEFKTMKRNMDLIDESYGEAKKMITQKAPKDTNSDLLFYWAFSTLLLAGGAYVGLKNHD